MPLTIQGRFFHRDGQRIFLRAVTYGPFDPEKPLDPVVEFPRIVAAGFNAIRLYHEPDRKFLNLARGHGLLVIATVPWNWNSLFTEKPGELHQAREKMRLMLRSPENWANVLQIATLNSSTVVPVSG